MINSFFQGEEDQLDLKELEQLSSDCQPFALGVAMVCQFLRSDFNNLELMIPVLSMQAQIASGRSKRFETCFAKLSKALHRASWSCFLAEERFSGFERKIQIKDHNVEQLESTFDIWCWFGCFVDDFLLTQVHLDPVGVSCWPECRPPKAKETRPCYKLHF